MCVFLCFYVPIVVKDFAISSALKDIFLMSNWYYLLTWLAVFKSFPVLIIQFVSGFARLEQHPIQ